MPLSVSFTLAIILPLSNCPVLSMCEYVSPVSLLTDTCPARSNSRTFVGVLNKPSLLQTHCCTLFITVRPSFLPSSPSMLIWPAVRLTQRQMALKPDSYVWHRITNNIRVYEFVVDRQLTRNILVVHKFDSVRAQRLGRPPTQRCCHLTRWTRGQPSGSLKSVRN